MPSQLPFKPDTAQRENLLGLMSYVEAGILSRVLYSGPNLRLVEFSLTAGQELTEHTNARRAFVQVLDGSCLFLFNGEWQRLVAGDLLHMPPAHPHAVKADQGNCSFLLTLHGEIEREEQD